MSLVSALSKLLVKMGGTPTSGDNSDELVNKIAEAYTPSTPISQYVVNLETNEGALTADQMAGVIYDHLHSSYTGPVIFVAGNGSSIFNLVYAESNNGEYEFLLETGTGSIVLTASSGDSYPSFTE